VFHLDTSILVNTIIKTTSVCDTTSVGGGRGWLAGELSKLWQFFNLMCWPVTVVVVEVGVVDTHYGVSQPGADAKR